MIDAFKQAQSDEIAEQVKVFLSKRKNKIQKIEEGQSGYGEDGLTKKLRRESQKRKGVKK